MRIIAVDDEMSALNTLLESFVDNEGLDYQFFMNDPLLAVDYVKSNETDVAFLDISMPKINGVTLAEKIVEARPSIKLVFITAFEQNDEELKNKFKSNFASFYYKPYDTEEMKELLSSLKAAINKTVKIVTFGCFNVFVNGIPLRFSCSKAKELLAYLVNAKGGFVQMGSVIAALWEDKNLDLAKKLYKDAVFRLRRTLAGFGIENLVTFGRAQLALNVKEVYCDYWEYLKFDTKEYNGEYLSEYGWSLDTQLKLDNIYN